MSEKKKYRKVRVDYFRHEKTRGLGAIAKLLMIYLTTPHASGICVKSIAQMRSALDVSLPVDAVRAALGELVQVGVVRWDIESEVVWVVEALDEQCDCSKKHPNMAKGVMAHIDTLPPSPLVAEFLERYGSWLQRSGVHIDGDGSDSAEAAAQQVSAVAPPNPSADPSTDPFMKGSGNPLPDPSGNQVQVQVQEQVAESREGHGLPTPPRAKAAPTCRASPNSNSNPAPTGQAEYLDAERQIAHAFDAALGIASGHGAYQYAMERWQKQEATIEEILAVIAWWSENKALAGCQLRQCFQRWGAGAQWSRIEALALNRNATPSLAPGPTRRTHGPPVRPTQDEVRAIYRRATEGT